MQESRLWNSAEGRTYSMRSKEQAHDYRYFPEPDLPPLVVSDAWQRDILSGMPELPEARRARLVSQYGLSRAGRSHTNHRPRAGRQVRARRKGRPKSPRRVAAILLSEITARLRTGGLELGASPVSLDGVVLAADLAEAGEISSKQLKQLLDTCFAEGRDFAQIYSRDKPQQISDTSAIEAMIDAAIAANPAQVAQFKAGKRTVAAFFVGQVMKLSKGQANPAVLNELVLKKLDA